MARSVYDNVPSPPKGRYYSPPPDVRKAFAKRLNARLKELGLSQSDAARRASMFLTPGNELSRNMLSHYCRAKHVPRPDKLDALARALECEPQDLMPPGSVQSLESSSGPELSMKRLSDKGYWLQINIVTTPAKAMQVMEILESDDD